mmetsp:Transcript_21083/g.58093  ORF Transcript_21083/g.58093 Transcript_21083/m.58093 type:complete len:284 (+) Transcript_21083:15-866(+)
MTRKKSWLFTMATHKRNYGALVIADVPSRVGVGYLLLASLVILAVCAPLTVYFTQSNLEHPAVLLSVKQSASDKELAALNDQISKDEQLLQSQEALVNKAEALLLAKVSKANPKVNSLKFRDLTPFDQYSPDEQEAMNPRPLAHHVPPRRSYWSFTKEEQDAMNPRPPASAWQETVPDNSHVYLQSTASDDTADESETTDGDKIADWNTFFNQFTKRVDAPKWDVKDIVADNLENIKPCNIDCSKDGTVSSSHGTFSQPLIECSVPSSDRPFGLRLFQQYDRG